MPVKGRTVVVRYSAGFALTGTFARRKKLMTHLLSRRWRIGLLIFIPLLVSFACLSGGSPASTPTPDMVRVPADVAFGPGPFILTDPKVGLAELTSYKATLTYSFDGTRAGQAEKWSKTYIMLTTKEPATRQLTIETAGNIPNVDAVFMAEADGAAYQRLGKNDCSANVMEQGQSFADWLEPAGILTGVIGADEAGDETVNSVPAKHYSFDERALGLLGAAKSTGEMWVASKGDYLVKYLLTTKGDANYLGEGTAGALTWDYELTDVNQPVTLALPADCPAGMVNAPQLPDASNVVNMPGLLAYDTASSLGDAAAFYQKQIPALGWKLIGNPTVTDTTALLDFTQKDQNMTVIITTDAGGTKVNILLAKAQK
jgi:hypothetical protein